MGYGGICLKCWRVPLITVAYIPKMSSVYTRANITATLPDSYAPLGLGGARVVFGEEDAEYFLFQQVLNKRVVEDNVEALFNLIAGQPRDGVVMCSLVVSSDDCEVAVNVDKLTLSGKDRLEVNESIGQLLSDLGVEIDDPDNTIYPTNELWHGVLDKILEYFDERRETEYKLIIQHEFTYDSEVKHLAPISTVHPPHRSSQYPNMPSPMGFGAPPTNFSPCPFPPPGYSPSTFDPFGSLPPTSVLRMPGMMPMPGMPQMPGMAREPLVPPTVLPDRVQPIVLGLTPVPGFGDTNSGLDNRLFIVRSHISVFNAVVAGIITPSKSGDGTMKLTIFCVLTPNGHEALPKHCAEVFANIANVIVAPDSMRTLFASTLEVKGQRLYLPESILDQMPESADKDYLRNILEKKTSAEVPTEGSPKKSPSASPKQSPVVEPKKEGNKYKSRGTRKAKKDEAIDSMMADMRIADKRR